jgi:hypothetical protein
MKILATHAKIPNKIPMIRIMDGTWELKSSEGVFRLKIEHGDVSIGGKDMCVLLTYKGPNDSMLHWFGTDAQCELRGFPIKGDKTKHLLYLATSIFRSIHRDVNYIKLIDSSTYKCGNFPDGKSRPISLRESHFVFHGKTYYEDKFGAVPTTSEGASRMEALRKAIHDPSKKPEKFTFGNPELAKELTPLYNSTNTWWDFFQQIQEKWKKEKCAKIYIWYRIALSNMFGDTIPEHWTLDMRKFPIIRPNLKRMPTKGGTRKRRKSIQYYPFDDMWDATGLF